MRTVRRIRGVDGGPLGSPTALRTWRDGLEINGVAHIILRVSRFEECVAFYDALMPRLGLAAVFRTDEFVYYVGGRTAFGIRRPAPELAGHAHAELAPGIDHVCFRARTRADVDALYPFLREIGRAGAGGRAVGTGLLLALVPGSRRDSLGGQPRAGERSVSGPSALAPTRPTPGFASWVHSVFGGSFASGWRRALPGPARSGSLCGGHEMLARQ
jgi:catechol 2,3-dioxygenase-like lactoylglutathione lyase family enzyme